MVELLLMNQYILLRFQKNDNIRQLQTINLLKEIIIPIRINKMGKQFKQHQQFL